MVNNDDFVTEPRSKKVLTIFKVLLENCIRMISCDSTAVNLKVVLHRNRLKPMEKFAYKSPQRFHCKTKS